MNNKKEILDLGDGQMIMPGKGSAIESMHQMFYKNCVHFLTLAEDEEKKAITNTINMKMINYSCSALLFAALGLESFINYFGDKNLGTKYFESIDKLGPYEKFIVVSDLVSGKKKWLSNEYTGDLKHLFKIRNKLVHYKQLQIDPKKGKSISKVYFVDDNKLGLKIFQKIIKKFYELDNTINI